MEKEKVGGCLPCEASLMEERDKDCILFQDYLTSEEEDILSALRKLREESRKIKDKIRGLEEGLNLRAQNQPESAFHKDQEALHRELGGCFEQLEKLRNVWKEWGPRREEANRRKMALLGYNP